MYKLEVSPVLFGDVTVEAHLVEGPLILTSRLLHDGCQERLRVEEAGEPHSGRQLKI